MQHYNPTSVKHYSVLTTEALVSFYYHTLDPHYPFNAPSHPSHLGTTNYCLHLWVCVYFVLFFHFLTYEWKHTAVIFSTWFILLCIILSRSTHFVANSKFPSFLWLSSIPLYTNQILKKFSHLSMDIFFPHLSYCK